MNNSRVRMAHKYGETPENTFSDFDWVRNNRPQLLEKYGECSIIVYEEKVIGVGETYQAAVANAEANLPHDVDEVTPIYAELFYYNPLSRLQQRQSDKSN